MEPKESNLRNSIIIQIILKLTPYIFFFFIFAFIGWIGETIFCYTVYGQTVKRGFLYGPICPIYGYGALILILYFYKHNFKKKNYINLFVLFILIFSFFEYFVGFALEALFSSRWWDYSDNKYSLNGRITILNSLIWGIATLIFTKFILPLLYKLKNIIKTKVPDIAKLIIDFILLSTILIDSIFSCIRYLS